MTAILATTAGAAAIGGAIGGAAYGASKLRENDEPKDPADILAAARQQLARGRVQGAATADRPVAQITSYSIQDAHKHLSISGQTVSGPALTATRALAKVAAERLSQDPSFRASQLGQDILATRHYQLVDGKGNAGQIERWLTNAAQPDWIVSLWNDRSDDAEVQAGFSEAISRLRFAY